MVIANFNVVSISVLEDEANTPLVINRYGILPQSVTFQLVQPIPWRASQIVNHACRIDCKKLSPRSL